MKKVCDYLIYDGARGNVTNVESIRVAILASLRTPIVSRLSRRAVGEQWNYRRKLCLGLKT